jgi:hypothetical protein
MKPFLSGRPHAATEPLQNSGPTGPGFVAKSAGNHTHPPGATSGATVECVKQGDKVTRLIVTCTCGERIEIECIYPAGS